MKGRRALESRGVVAAALFFAAGMVTLIGCGVERGPEQQGFGNVPGAGGAVTERDSNRDAALSSNGGARVDSPSDARIAVLHGDAGTFEEQVLQSNVPVLVDFYADWCGPCRELGPVFEELAAETPQVKFVKVNVDDSRELAARYRIVSIPHLLLFKNGRVIASQKGLTGKSQLKSLIGR
jgi:thioredoxin 1